MKLNERSVAHYATCNSPPDKTGFLFKKGERNTAYHRRWFILKGNMLFYFEERESREPIGVIVLEGCTVELCESESEEFAFAVKFDCIKARVYKMAAESQAGMESWVKALSRASFDYMRLVVKELERQLEEVQEARSLQAKSKAKKQQTQVQGAEAGPRTATPSQQNTAITGPSQEGLSSRENGVTWSKHTSSANGVSEGCDYPSRASGVRPPPVPPRRKTNGGSLESPVSPGTGCFSKLHEWYGKEVAELRIEWLQSK
ncbi:sesquipedalian-1 [Rhinichthys klamathensis goyatoka]|uniref:sesquipedalian-1 n=1 Tax=Rhinichthys klamathensis goyatoka TaxID=3034132 RepID=UPI0024B50FD7|nr:sesquipedalian-1 [Rhinichthys klamathensis goyatoka]XP_056110761.1 sesquipedalian-1 [Rhinichthys klamathensis goyatoka]